MTGDLASAKQDLAVIAAVAAIQPPGALGLHRDLPPGSGVVHAANQDVVVVAQAANRPRERLDIQAPGSIQPEGQRLGLVSPDLGVGEVLPVAVLFQNHIGVAENRFDPAPLLFLGDLDQAGDVRSQP